MINRIANIGLILILLMLAIFIGLSNYNGIGKNQQLPNVFSSHIVVNNNNLPQEFLKYRFFISVFIIQPLFNKEIQITQMHYSVLNYSSGIVHAIKCHKEIELEKEPFRDLHRIIQAAENSEDAGII
ncbi:MAG: hypothetical protein HOD63_02390 [Bacteroidetes bacterium]|jgi:predicted small integral membrane protein|nr:hypothetical protein [Bacteroidota bacterium]MBT5530779.1 hypothetical protein [Cytophagia bacterium]MBT4337418.1 hypothetical protein [Bacteroidota bacterium]MBT4727337.1 hypothetical protein [Bacteroidota bacterium]MBT6836534.1 hypothetical protein [Bacteroidota bacterium]